MSLRVSRRQFLVGLAALGASSAAYSRFAEPYWLEVSVTRVPLSAAAPARPVRILHLSDFHASEFVSLDFIAHSIELGLAERPDLAVLTGDFVTRQCDTLPDYSQVLRRLAVAVPTYACLGNHDGGIWAEQIHGYKSPEVIQTLLRNAGITCLFNEARAIVVTGRPFQIFGVGDLWARGCQPDAAFSAMAERNGAVRVVLCHNPDAKDLFRRHDWDLMLCGHTHGGQLRLPLIGTPFAPVVDKRYVEGLHRWENRWLHITRGVGNLHGVRFNCRPQVSLLDIA